MSEIKLDLSVSFNLNYHLELTAMCDVDERASDPNQNGAACCESIADWILAVASAYTILLSAKHASPGDDSGCPATQVKTPSLGCPALSSGKSTASSRLLLLVIVVGCVPGVAAGPTNDGFIHMVGAISLGLLRELRNAVGRQLAAKCIGTIVQGVLRRCPDSQDGSWLPDLSKCEDGDGRCIMGSKNLSEKLLSACIQCVPLHLRMGRTARALRMFGRLEGCTEQRVRRDANGGLSVIIALTDGYTMRVWPESHLPKPQVLRATRSQPEGLTTDSVDDVSLIALSAGDMLVFDARMAYAGGRARPHSVASPYLEEWLAWIGAPAARLTDCSVRFHLVNEAHSGEMAVGGEGPTDAPRQTATIGNKRAININQPDAKMPSTKILTPRRATGSPALRTRRLRGHVDSILPTVRDARQAKPSNIRPYASSEIDSRKGCLKRPCPCSRNPFNQAPVRSQPAADLAATEAQLRPSVSNDVRRNADHDANDPSLGASQGSGACRSPFAHTGSGRPVVHPSQSAKPYDPRWEELSAARPPSRTGSVHEAHWRSLCRRSQAAACVCGTVQRSSETEPSSEPVERQQTVGTSEQGWLQDWRETRDQHDQLDDAYDLVEQLKVQLYPMEAKLARLRDEFTRDAFEFMMDDNEDKVALIVEETQVLQEQEKHISELDVTVCELRTQLISASARTVELLWRRVHGDDEPIRFRRVVRRRADHDANDPSLGASQGSGACRSPFAQAAPEREVIRRMQRVPSGQGVVAGVATEAASLTTVGAVPTVTVTDGTKSPHTTSPMRERAMPTVVTSISHGESALNACTPQPDQSPPEATPAARSTGTRPSEKTAAWRKRHGFIVTPPSDDVLDVPPSQTLTQATTTLPLRAAWNKLGFPRDEDGNGSLTHLQQQIWPVVAMGYNLLAIAATDKDKTLACGAPALDVAYRAVVTSCDVTGRSVAGKRAGGGRHEPLLPLSTRPSNVAVLVVVQATKEMVDQTINSDFERLAKSLNLIISAIRNTRDVRTYRGAHVLVGTPVQLDKMRTSGHLKRVRTVVLYEADMLVDEAMTKVASIVKTGNADHLQVIAVSTSADDDSTRALTGLMTRPPWRIHSATGQQLSTSVEYNLLTAPPRFFNQRSNLFNDSPAAVAFWAGLAADVTSGRYATELPNRGGLSTLHKLMMFLPTRALCDGVYQRLRLHRSADTVYVLHGSVAEEKTKRSAGFNKFKDAGPGSTLITTPVAARGVDAEGVTLVITGMPYGKSIEAKRNGVLHCTGHAGRVTAEGTALVVVPEPGRWSLSDHALSVLHWLKPACAHVWSYTNEGELRDARLQPTAAVRGVEAAAMPPSPPPQAPHSTTMDSERTDVYLSDDSADCDDTSPSTLGRPASSCERPQEQLRPHLPLYTGAGAGFVDTDSDDESVDVVHTCDVRRGLATTQTAQATIDAAVRNTDDDDARCMADVSAECVHRSDPVRAAPTLPPALLRSRRRRKGMVRETRRGMGRKLE